MRSSKSLLLAGLAAIIAVTIIALGCSDDTKPTPPTPPEDHGIQSMLALVQGQVHEYLDSAVNTMESGLRVATFVDVGSADIGDVFMGSGLPDSTIDEHFWIISWLTDLVIGTGTLRIVDSLTYVVNGEMSINARGADAMYVKHNFSYENQDTTVTFTDVSNHGFVHFTGIDSATAVANGEFTINLKDKFVSADSTTWNNWTIQATVSDLTFVRTGTSWTSGCPNSGTCQVNVQYTYSRDEDIPTTTLWQFDITFTDGAMAVDVSTGPLSSSYEYTLCTP